MEYKEPEIKVQKFIFKGGFASELDFLSSLNGGITDGPPIEEEEEENSANLGDLSHEILGNIFGTL